MTHRVSAEAWGWRGYKPRCSCGWQGPLMKDGAAALEAARQHKEGISG